MKRMHSKRMGSVGVRLVAGLAGAATLTLLHQTLRRTLAAPPRMDVLGKRAIARGLGALGIAPPRGRRLERASLAGDLVANTLYYAALMGERPAARGAIGGFIAGVGALVLPERMGLGKPPHREALTNRALTIAIYTLGGLSAGAAQRALSRSSQ